MHAEEGCFLVLRCVCVLVFVKVVLCRCAGLGMRAAIVSSGKGRVIKKEQLEGVGVKGDGRRRGPRVGWAVLRCKYLGYMFLC